jgi:limonene 1,2-monooxygenase
MQTALKFGVFHPPYHMPPGRNAHILMLRDIEFIQHLDRLGFDEAWIGEHHSGGTETITDPMIFMAYAAAKTERIYLCTGVLSLPYHNPLWVADRIVLLDHLTNGRVKIGLGPGALTTDAYMIGIDPTTQREALEQDTEVLLKLLHGDEPVSIKTDRYTLQDARIQLGLHSDVEIAVAGTASPTGPRIAGRHGLGLLSIGATMARHVANAEDALAHMWGIFESQAGKFNQTADRSKWRLVGPMHIAETREQAEEDVRFGIDAWFDYFQNVQTATHFEVAGTTTDERIAWVRDSGVGVIGTPDDAIAQIDDLIEQSAGGFGAYLFMTHEWANLPSTYKSYELFAEHVMGRYQGQVEPLVANNNWARSRREELGAAQMQDVQNAIARQEAEDAAEAATRADAR